MLSFAGFPDSSVSGKNHWTYYEIMTLRGKRKEHR